MGRRDTRDTKTRRQSGSRRQSQEFFSGMSDEESVLDVSETEDRPENVYHSAEDGEDMSAFGSEDEEMYESGSEESTGPQKLGKFGKNTEDYYGGSDDESELEDPEDVEESLAMKAKLSSVMDAFHLFEAVKPVETSTASANIAVESLTFFKEPSTSQVGSTALESSPELEPLLAELREASEELKLKLEPLKAKLAKVVGDRKAQTSAVMSFAEVKTQLLLNYLTNLSFYCLMKVKGLSIREHPVIEQLAKVKLLLDKLKPVELRLRPQIEAALKSDANQGVSSAAGKLMDDIEESEDEEDVRAGVNADLPVAVEPKKATSAFKAGAAGKDKSAAASKLTEDMLEAIRAEFSSKPLTVAASVAKPSSKRDKAMEEKLSAKQQYEEETFLRLPTSKKEQEYVKKQKTKKALSLAGVDDLDDLADFSVRMGEGRKAASAQLAAHLNAAKQLTSRKPKNASADMYVDAKPNKEAKTPKMQRVNEVPAMEEPALLKELKAAKASKETERFAKRQEKALATRMPELEQPKEGARMAGYDIEKNKGLLRKRKKEDRNARVKNRNKFELAVKRRRGAVQDMRNDDEHGGKNYGGEATGIKANLKKSTKLM